MIIIIVVEMVMIIVILLGMVMVILANGSWHAFEVDRAGAWQFFWQTTKHDNMTMDRSVAVFFWQLSKHVNLIMVIVVAIW